MNENLRDLSDYRLEKAKNDLESSMILLEKGKFAQSANRSYYAIFHAVRALLALDKFDSKKHSGIISFFNKNYIKNSKIEIRFGQMLTSAEKIRIKSDYDDFYVIDKDTSTNQYNNAVEFIKMIERYLETLI